MWRRTHMFFFLILVYIIIIITKPIIMIKFKSQDIKNDSELQSIISHPDC